MFPKLEKLEIKRDKKFGGNLKFKSYEELENNFEEGKLHPADFKSAMIEAIEEVIAPIRKGWN